jgi:hypothetical protein
MLIALGLACGLLSRAILSRGILRISRRG